MEIIWKTEKMLGSATIGVITGICFALIVAMTTLLFRYFRYRTKGPPQNEPKRNVKKSPAAKKRSKKASSKTVQFSDEDSFDEDAGPLANAARMSRRAKQRLERQQAEEEERRRELEEQRARGYVGPLSPRPSRFYLPPESNLPPGPTRPYEPLDYSPEANPSTGAQVIGGITDTLCKIGDASSWIASKGMETWAKLTEDRREGADPNDGQWIALGSLSQEGRAYLDAASQSSSPRRGLIGPPSTSGSPRDPREISLFMPTANLRQRADARSLANTLGTLQPELYIERTTPVTIELPQEGGERMGRLHIKLKFEFDPSTLTVSIFEVSELPGGDQGGFYEPFLRMVVDPEMDKVKRETKVLTNDPDNRVVTYDEQFRVPVDHSELKSLALNFTLNDFDRFSQNDIIAERTLELSELDFITRIEVYLDLAKKPKPRSEFQELKVAITYLSAGQRLNITIIQARNLYVVPEKGYVNPFVKVALYNDGKKKKAKTSILRDCTDPIWNEAFSFHIKASELSRSHLEFTVLDHLDELFATHPVVGAAQFQCSDRGVLHPHPSDAAAAAELSRGTWLTLR